MKKHIKKFLGKLVLSASLAVAVLSASLARAETGIENMYITNTINAAVDIRNAPTNTPGTVNTNTGHFVNVASFSEFGFVFTAGTYSTNTTDTISVTLTKAAVQGQPTGSDFETLASWGFTVPVPVGTNNIVYITNAPTLFCLGATHVGVSRLTNNVVGTLATCTNAALKVIKKRTLSGYP